MFKKIASLAWFEKILVILKVILNDKQCSELNSKNVLNLRIHICKQFNSLKMVSGETEGIWENKNYLTESIFYGNQETDSLTRKGYNKNKQTQYV